MSINIRMNHLWHTQNNGKPRAIEEKGELLPQQYDCVSVWSQRALAEHFHVKFKCSQNAQQWWGWLQRWTSECPRVLGIFYMYLDTLVMWMYTYIIDWITEGGALCSFTTLLIKSCKVLDLYLTYFLRSLKPMWTWEKVMNEPHFITTAISATHPRHPQIRNCII